MPVVGRPATRQIQDRPTPPDKFPAHFLHPRFAKPDLNRYREYVCRPGYRQVEKLTRAHPAMFLVLSSDGIPKLNGSVQALGCQLFAIRAKCDSMNGFRVASPLQDKLTRRSLPYFGRTIITGGCQLFAVWTKNNAGEIRVLSLERDDFS